MTAVMSIYLIKAALKAGGFKGALAMLLLPLILIALIIGTFL